MKPDKLLPEALTPVQWLTLAWDTLGNGRWGPPTPPQVYAMEAMTDPDNDRLIWEGFRGMAKSTTAAVACTYFWLQDRRLQILVFSEGQGKADDFSNQVWKLLHGMGPLNHLRPQKDDRQRINGFDLGVGSMEQSKSMTSIGIFGNSVGKRADIIICDDVEVPRTCETQGMREKLWSRVGDLHNLLRPEGPGRILFLGTPHSENSIYTRLRDQKGYRTMIWPARYPTEEQQLYYGETLHWKLRRDLIRDPKLAGRPTDNQRFPDDILTRKEAECNTPADRARQYMLDPRIGDLERYPLKINDLMVMDLDTRVGPKQAIYSRIKPIKGVENFNVGFDGDRFHHPLNLDSMEFVPYQDVRMFVDPSGSGADETAFVVTGWSNGNLCILDWGGNSQWGPASDGFSDKTLGELCNRALAFGAPQIIVEDNYGSGMFTSLLQKHIRDGNKKLGVEPIKVKGNKEQRIMANVRPMLSQNRVILNLRLIEQDYVRSQGLGREAYRALYQLSHFIPEKGSLEHDDRLDVLCLACEFYQERAAIDSTAVLEKERVEELKKLARGMAFPLGPIPSQPNGIESRGKRNLTNPVKGNRYGTLGMGGRRNRHLGNGR